MYLKKLIFPMFKVGVSPNIQSNSFTNSQFPIPNSQIPMKVHYNISNGEKYIYFNNRFNDPLEKYDYIIRRVNTIMFSSPPYPMEHECEYIISPYKHLIRLPKNIKAFDAPANYPHDIVLTKNMYRLSSGYLYDKPLKLSKNIRRVNLGFTYNTQLSLTKHISRFNMGTSYNQPLDIGKNLTRLHVEIDFNCLLSLPKNLTHLTFVFDSSFDHRIYLTKNIKLFMPHCSYGSHGSNESNDDIIEFPMDKLHIPHEFIDARVYDNLPNGLTDYVSSYHGVQLFNMPSVPCARAVTIHNP